MKLAVVGANGRMGRAVIRLAHGAGLTLVAAVAQGDEGKDAGELAGLGALGISIHSDANLIASSGADVCIDFSSPRGLEAACIACAKGRIALVSGTTGLDENAKAALADASGLVAVLWEPNMSVGVHVLAALVTQAARLLDGFDVEITETHHRDKVDAPSGTAIRLSDAVRAARSNLELVNGRVGRPGPRKATELGMHAIRGGDVIGDHTVNFFGDGERIELTHKATSRDLFAHGALVAARAIHGKPPGQHGLAGLLL